MGLSKVFKTVGQSLGFVAPDTEKVDTSQSIAANKEAANSLKSAEELQKEGTNLAGMQANNAAVTAADNARNAVANSGGGKLARALAASNAASAAGSDTFNSSLQSNIATAADQNKTKAGILSNQANIQANAAQANAASANAAEQNRNNAASKIIGGVAGGAANALLSKIF